MSDETSPDAPTAGAPAVPPSGDQADPATQPAEAQAPVVSADPISNVEPATPAGSEPAPGDAAAPEGGLHRLISNGLHIFGKIEHWTAEEISAFVAWLESRL